MYFDARAAKLLKPGEHIVVDGCPGLRLTASATRKTWAYRYETLTTKLMKQIKIGPWPEMPPAAAAAKWQELRARRDMGEDLVADKKAAAVAVKVELEKSYTLGELIYDYATDHLDKMRQPKGAKAVRVRLNNALEAYKDLPVTAVNRRFVYDLVAALSVTPVLAKSVKTEMGAAWSHALDAGRIDDDLPNWWLLVKKIGLRSKGAIRDGEYKGTTKRTLSESEITTLMQSDMDLFR